jgi:hypothetical protein
MKSNLLRSIFTSVLIACALMFPLSAQDTGILDKESADKLFKKPGYSPYAGRHYPTRVFWGDTHLHTAIS